ncbi:uncharacterized protein LOC143285970 isoform X2 [Babylonia areolata]
MATDDFTNAKAVAERWLLENNSKFQLLSVDEKENQLVFGNPDVQSSFIINCPSTGESWSVCSEEESMLLQLQDVMEWLDCQQDLTIDAVLHRITRCLSRVGGSATQGTSLSSPQKQGEHDEDNADVQDDEGEDEEEDMDFDNYYENDPDAAAQHEDENPEEDDTMHTFYQATAGHAEPSTVKRLCSDMRSLATAGEKYGFSACPQGNNLFKWTVKLLDIPKDCKLGRDLQCYVAQTKKEAAIQMEMQFPADYPFSPPFLRVIQPRFKFLTGHVTTGGSICMEMLTKSGWLPTNDIESILVQVRSEILSDPKAALDKQK